MKNLAILFGLLVACQGPAYSPTVRFEATDLEPYKGPGTASVSGQAFLKTRGGDVKYGAANKVELIPAIPFVMDVYDNAIKKGGHYQLPEGHPLAKSIRTTVGDGEGRFKFENVPPGTYVLICAINWEYGGGYKTGGYAHNLVMLREGQHKERVVVTR